MQVFNIGFERFLSQYSNGTTRVHTNQLLDIPEDVIKRYNLREIVDADGYEYCQLEKGMYGLPQAGIIAQEILEERLGKEGYFQSQTTPGLWMLGGDV